MVEKAATMNDFMYRAWRMRAIRFFWTTAQLTRLKKQRSKVNNVTCIADGVPDRAGEPRLPFLDLLKQFLF